MTSEWMRSGWAVLAACVLLPLRSAAAESRLCPQYTDSCSAWQTLTEAWLDFSTAFGGFPRVMRRDLHGLAQTLDRKADEATNEEVNTVNAYYDVAGRIDGAEAAVQARFDACFPKVAPIASLLQDRSRSPRAPSFGFVRGYLTGNNRALVRCNPDSWERNNREPGRPPSWNEKAYQDSKDCARDMLGALNASGSAGQLVTELRDSVPSSCDEPKFNGLAGWLDDVQRRVLERLAAATCAGSPEQCSGVDLAEAERKRDRFEKLAGCSSVRSAIGNQDVTAWNGIGDAMQRFQQAAELAKDPAGDGSRNLVNAFDALADASFWSANGLGKLRNVKCRR